MKTVITGNSGSGKSTLALAIKEATGCEVIHLDRHFWRKGWTRPPKVEWEAFQKNLVQQESWIIEGLHLSTIDIRLEVADTVIVLDPPSWICVLHVIMRVIKGWFFARPDLPAGLREKFDFHFLYWILIFPYGDGKILKNKVNNLPLTKKVIVLRSRRDVSSFISSLKGV